MKANEQKIDDNKVDKFFNKQLEMFINNANRMVLICMRFVVLLQDCLSSYVQAKNYSMKE